mmetsp:Transcript_28231/g.72010  ORF Transcript_28231/g.72010 Transcript_28231/m.72010 type:complete len:345 (+) Transcript_28231:231-1265(+)
MMIGPLVGSLLYSTSGNISLIHPSNITTGGNFGLPFFGAAGAEIVCLAGVMILLPRKYRKSRIEQGKNGDMTYVSVMDMMKKWRIILLVVVMSMSIASLTLLDPIFQPYASSSFNDTPLIIGLAFSGIVLVFSISSVVAGKIVEKTYAQVNVIVGLFLVSVAFALIGPLPWLPSLQTSTVSMIGLVLLAISLSFAIIPIPGEILLMGKGIKGGKGDVALAESSLTSAAYSAGAMIGPLLGSAVDDAAGFDWACLVAAAINFFLALLLLVMCSTRLLPWDVAKKKVKELERGRETRDIKLIKAEDAQERQRMENALYHESDPLLHSFTVNTQNLFSGDVENEVKI